VESSGRLKPSLACAHGNHYPHTHTHTRTHARTHTHSLSLEIAVEKVVAALLAQVGVLQQESV